MPRWNKRANPLGFQKRFLFLFVLICLVEVFIALFINDRFIRPFVGDILVIVLLYVFIRIFYIKGHPVNIALCIFFFACLVELGQYFGLVSLLKLPETSVAAIMLGTTFDWLDILAYATGVIIIIGVNKLTPHIR
ncbi:MAG: DUF2809 domain-containing protein [Chloroflexi bacterium HGW-Chloroflexi-10]|nr:MAG: DUF2809 domain-containing protein [Chloroflexi bacterium HGW-Chloroflexi-10]